MVKATIANLAWLAASAGNYIAFTRALNEPAAEQEKLFRRYLQQAGDTAFGREHGLSEIRTYEQFCKRVPIRDYDQLQPWIDRIRRGEQRVLSRDPVRRLVPTSGSTAARKLIPYTAESHRELNRAIGPWICDLYRSHSRMILGRSYWSVTPSAQDDSSFHDSRVAIGFEDDSAYLGNWSQRVVDAAMAVPGSVKDISSIDVLRHVTLLLLLRCRDLSLISVWHPSFLELLLAALPGHWENLLSDVATGGCSVLADVPDSVRRHLKSRPDPRRAQKLRRMGFENLPRLWPMLTVASCWGDANATGAATALSSMLPGVAIQPKGLLATEGIISIPFAGHYPLAIRSHFFEFIDSHGTPHLAADVKTGESYDAVLTTAGGLWRYRLNDVVQVTGIVGRTPSVRFTGKSGLISDRVGEKLSDGFIAAVLTRLFGSQFPRPSFTFVAPEETNNGWRYTLYMNADGSGDVCKLLEIELQRNPQYAYCRRLDQLRHAAIFCISGDAYAAYAARLCSQGQRLGDIKPASLNLLIQWPQFFTGKHVEIVTE